MPLQLREGEFHLLQGVSGPEPVANVKEVADGKIDMRADKDHKREFRVLFPKKSNVMLKQKSSSISFPLICMATKIDSTQIHKAS